MGYAHTGGNGGRRPAPLAVAAALAVALVTGCGGAAQHSGPAVGPASGPVQDAGQKSAALPGRDVVISAGCTVPAGKPATVWVDGYAPGSWKQVASAQFTIPANVVISKAQGPVSALQDLCADNFPNPGADDGPASDRVSGPRIRELFNRDFTRLAVVTSDDKTGASHVGYLDRAGDFTDLTGTPTGFSSTPKEKDALFAPDGGSVWFTYSDPQGQLHIASRDITADHHLTDQWTGSTGGDTELELGGSPLHGVIGGQVVFSPDGQHAAGFVDLNGENVLPVTASGPLTSTDTTQIPDEDCAPSGWTDNHTVLCAPRKTSQVAAPYQNNLWTIDVTRMRPGDYDHAKDAASQPLLPATDRANLPEAVSPDGKQLLFRSTQGKEETAFVTPLTPGTQPQQITTPTAATALGSVDFILEWR